MRTRAIAGVKVSAIGLGAMPMSLEGRPDEEQSIRTIHAALDEGVTLIDTADAYCIDDSEIGHNERLIAKALASWPSSETVYVATKGGHTRPGDGSWAQDGSPEHLRAACEASLRALGVDSIWLYQYHRPDSKVPFAESVDTLAELQAEGKVQLLGLSNVSIAQIDEARSIADVASVQNEFSPAYRDSQPELWHCNEQGIAFLPWSPLGGIGSAGDLGERNRAFSEVAEECGVSPQRVALAWELNLAPNVIPIPGASRPETIKDSLGAAELELSDEQLHRLNG
jgi:aryl-alcohol dehydrogenase-like predicted oxidoreductase